jgi:RHS repeat-associated protein
MILFMADARDFDSVKNQRTDAGFVYDANGNPTTYKGTSGLTYDPNDKLITYPGMLSAGYHGGLRAWKDTGTSRIYIQYTGIVPTCEMDDDGNVTAVNTVGINGLLARREGENTTFYTFDDSGDVTQTLNSSGTVLSSEQYDSYGNRLAINGTNNTPYGYKGQHDYYIDRETGLILATHRYYDPSEGRWLTRDPIGYAGGLNLYDYCDGNPINLVDPLGLCGEQPGDDDIPAPDWSDPWGTIIWPGLKTGAAGVGSAFTFGKYDGGKYKNEPGFGVSKGLGYVAVGSLGTAGVLYVGGIAMGAYQGWGNVMIGNYLADIEPLVQAGSKLGYLNLPNTMYTWSANKAFLWAAKTAGTITVIWPSDKIVNPTFGKELLYLGLL